MRLGQRGLRTWFRLYWCHSFGGFERSGICGTGEGPRELVLPMSHTGKLMAKGKGKGVEYIVD